MNQILLHVSHLQVVLFSQSDEGCGRKIKTFLKLLRIFCFIHICKYKNRDSEKKNVQFILFLTIYINEKLNKANLLHIQRSFLNILTPIGEEIFLFILFMS